MKGKYVFVLVFLVIALITSNVFASLTGEIEAWGRDDRGQVSNTPSGNNFTAIAAGDYYGLVLKSDHSIDAWGWDAYGQVSDKPSGNSFTAIAAGGSHGLALKLDGTIDAWGRDWDGQVSNTPTSSDFTAIAAGVYHSLGLKFDGSIVAWGNDDHEQISNAPTDAGFTAIAAGNHHDLALKSDGSLVSWGWDGWGQVSDTPSGTDFIAIAAGGNNSLALKSDGSIVAWGDISNTPIDTDFVAIAAGAFHNLALKSDGSIVAWGLNGDGQCSTIPGGTTTLGDYWYSTRNDFVDIAGGGYHSLALIPEPPCVASFQSLGDLPGGSFLSYGWAVSPDGSVVVGQSSSSSGTEAFRWTSVIGMEGLGDATSVAQGCSTDGSTIVGHSNMEARFWREPSGIQLLDGAEARDVSADGSIIVGRRSGVGVRWREDNSWIAESIGGYDATGISTDGTVIVGRTTGSTDSQAFYWTEPGGLVVLGDLLGGGYYSVAYAVSADGKVVVGHSKSASGYDAFRWEDLNNDGNSDPGEMQGLSAETYYAYGVSADGSVIVGRTDSDQAFIWDECSGVRNLKEVLVNDYGLDLTGWSLKRAYGISDDGLTIVGYGTNPDGHNEAWVARLCEPAEPNIAVSPLSHDFGDVELGTSRTVIVTISNVGTGDLTISSITLETDFAITSAPAAAIVVEPGATKDVEITYTPSALGRNSAVLKITSDDLDEPVVEVTLGAVGIEIPPPPSEQIANILTFFDASVEEGTLLGDGLGNSAEKRLNALRNMIEAAGDLIERELFEKTCQQLSDAYRRMDGQPTPPDFVKGEAVPELASMAQDLMTSLGCE